MQIKKLQSAIFALLKRRFNVAKSFISEDDIEKSILDKIENENLGYTILKLDPSFCSSY